MKNGFYQFDKHDVGKVKIKFLGVNLNRERKEHVLDCGKQLYWYFCSPDGVEVWREYSRSGLEDPKYTSLRTDCPDPKLVAMAKLIGVI